MPQKSEMGPVMPATHKFRPKLRSLPAASLLLCAGCSAAIAYSGQDISKLTTKSHVHESFGEPENCGTKIDYEEKPTEFEEYRTRRKISEPDVAGIHLLLGLETLGLFEPFNLLSQAGITTWSTLFGQTVRFDYDDFGKVKQVYINGTRMENRASLP